MVSPKNAQSPNFRRLMLRAIFDQPAHLLSFCLQAFLLCADESDVYAAAQTCARRRQAILALPFQQRRPQETKINESKDRNHTAWIIWVGRAGRSVFSPSSGLCPKSGAQAGSRHSRLAANANRRRAKK